MLYLLSRHQTAGLPFSTVYTQDGGVGVKAPMPPAQLRPLHVMYSHCPYVARQPQPPWPPCVICVLWCSRHHHLTRIHTHRTRSEPLNTGGWGIVMCDVLPVTHTRMVERHSSSEIGLDRLVWKQIVCCEPCFFVLNTPGIVHCSKLLSVRYS